MGGDCVSTVGEEQETDESPECSSCKIELLGSGLPSPSEGSIIGDGEADNGELEEFEQRCPAFG